MARVNAAAAALALAASTALPAQAQGAELPLWEAGAGVAVLNFPDYRGSDQRHTLVLPLPYLVYRGEFLKADRESVRGEFYNSERIELHVSANGSIPVESKDNVARSGMPDLDPTLEIGPNLTLNVLRSDTVRLNLRFPLRAVIATDLAHARDEGWVFTPQLNVDLYDLLPGPGSNLGFAAGPLYTNRRYHNYFYGVAPQFATPVRPAYDAPGGYSGTQFLAALSKRFPSYWIGAFARADSLSGAAFEASPLVRQKQAFAAGIAVAWVFGRSRRLVESKEP
jgi:outer membrane scaffolding protein for murein synthesis (MipA/OmpV family)